MLEQAASGLSTEWHESYNPAETFQSDANNFSAFTALYKLPPFLCTISMSFLGDDFNIRLAYIFFASSSLSFSCEWKR